MRGGSHQPVFQSNTFIFRGYNPYIGGLKPSFFMVLGSKGWMYLHVLFGHMILVCQCHWLTFGVFFFGCPTTTRMYIKPFIDGGDAWELRG